MSWLEDLTPDAGDPSTGMIMGLLGGLGQAAAPQFQGNLGISGQSKGNALLQLFGDLSGGVQGGMQGAQQYKAQNTANQSAAIDLQNKQAMNPLMMQARMGALQGMNNNPTGLPGAGAMPGSLGGNAPQMSPYQQNAANMIQSAQRHFALTGDDKPLTDAWKSAFENDPSLGAEKEKQKALNTVQTTPNGPMAGYQIPGMSDAPGGSGSPGLFGSLAPAATSRIIGNIVSDRAPGVMGPGNQQPAEMPTAQPIDASSLNQSPQGGAPPPPSPMSLQGASPGGGSPIPPPQPVQGPQALPPMPQDAQPPQAPQAQDLQSLIAQQQANKPTSVIPSFNPFSKVSTDAASKTAEENASNAAEAAKSYNVMIQNFPNMMQRIKDMSDANKLASFNPMNDKEGNGIVTSYHDARNDKVSDANAKLQQRAAQGVLPELGPALAQAGIKGNKYLETLANSSTNLDLSKGMSARQTQIDGLMKAYIQNMKSSHDQISGLGGSPAPLPPPVVAQAVKYGVMTRAEAEKYLQDNHGMSK